MSRRRLRLRPLAVVVALSALAGCGVDPDRQPRDLAAERVPFSLLVPLTSTTSTSTTAPIATAPAFVYLLAEGRLVPVVRELASPLSLRDALGSLLEGPTDAEAAQGLRTAITTEVLLRGVVIEGGGVALVDLSTEFAAVGNPQQIEALAQLVFTATSVPGVTAVRFAIEGEAVEVPTGDGPLTRTPVGRAQFAPLAPA